MISRLGKPAFLLLCLACSCGKKEQPTPHRPEAPVQPQTAAAPALSTGAQSELPRDWDKWSPEKQKHWNEKMPADSKARWLELDRRQPETDAREARDRRDYIRPSPPGFKPENAARKITLALFAEKEILRKGEPFRYRAELQNVGREEISFYQKISFFKTGGIESYNSDGFRLYAIRPGQKEMTRLRVKEERELPGGTEIRLPGWEGMNDAQKHEAVKRHIDDINYGYELRATLKPGETLVSKPKDQPKGSYLIFHGDYKYWKHGTYRIKLVYVDSPPAPLTEEKILKGIKRGNRREIQVRVHEEMMRDSLGVIESNIVTIEVVP